jgi:hypothetical protein
MKTLTVTAARQNLGAWLKRSLQGEDVGVVIDGAVVAFRPVKIYSEDYAEQEYGVTAGQLDRFAGKANRELDAERKSGQLKPFTGKLKRG